VFYIDGVESSTLAYSATLVRDGSRLGARPDTIEDTFMGTIDELAVYSRVLDPMEIQAIYNNAAGKCRPPYAPTITLQPLNKTDLVGESVIFNVATTGDLPLFYQWRFND